MGFIEGVKLSLLLVERETKADNVDESDMNIKRCDWRIQFCARFYSYQEVIKFITYLR